MDRSGHDPILSLSVAIPRPFPALAAALLLAAPLAAQPAAPPALDQARAVDAEVRVAMFDLLVERPLAAMSRLRALRQAPEAQLEGNGSTYGQAEAQFLLAESYARLGMSDAFRQTARTLLESGNTRYAPLLQMQLLLDAYRRGAYQEAVSLAQSVSANDRAFAGLVGGLASYRLGDPASARTSFDAAVAAGGPFAGYSRYMSALALMAGDTAQTQATITALQGVAGDALGEFADQVNLTIAQLSYQRGDYEAASAAAGRVSATGGLSSSATLTRAWSLYKASQFDAASQAFTDFATRFPHLPERDEARLMVGQVMLQQQRIDDAGRHFQAIADSLNGDLAVMRAGSAAAMAEAARSFVQARAATLLFLQQPAAGKVLALPDNHGMDQAAIAQVMGASAPATPPGQLRPEIISLADVGPRLDSLAPASGGGVARRAVYLTDSGGPTRAEFVRRSQALSQADVVVAVARYQLAEQLAAHNAKLALIERLQEMLGEAAAQLDTLSRELTQARDSLTRLSQMTEEESMRVRELIQREAEAVRLDAADNARRADSLRASFGTMLSADDAGLIEVERQTSLTYQQLANNVMNGLASVFARHPVVRLQDTVRAHIAATEGLVGDTRATISSTNAALMNEMARMRATEDQRTGAARAALASAEAARATAEGSVLVAAEAELRARADMFLGMMSRDAQAAEFGAASASFFKAVGSPTASGTLAEPPGGAAGEPDESSPR